MVVVVKLLSHVRLLAWTTAYQAPPSMGFSRQECWSGVPLPSLKLCTKDYMRTMYPAWRQFLLSESEVQLLSCVLLFATPRTAVHQASLSITNYQSLLKLMSIESVMLSNHLILCRPLLLLPSIFPRIRSFPMSQFFASGGQSIGVSASASVLPMTIQDWFPLDWLVWSPCSPRDFQESSPTPQSSKASIL